MTALDAEAPAAAPPPARGPLSEWVLGRLTRPTAADDGWPGRPPPVPADPRAGEDFHLSLYLLYELHFGGFEGVDPEWEWDPSLLAVRRGLERAFEAALVEELGPAAPVGSPDGVEAALRAIGAGGDGAVSLPGHIARSGTLEEARELVVHRSAYQLKEADPHTWTVPRLRGAPKASLMEVQFDEYGSGEPGRLHQTLYAETMDDLGLDPRPGAYLDLIPGVTLATANLASLFGLHRRLRGASVGHLALFEMTSPDANRRYGHGLRRLGLGPRATGFYDEHVEADALHDAIAVHDVAGALARAEPALADQIVFGARALVAVESRFSEHVLGRWGRGECSLRAELPALAAA